MKSVKKINKEGVGNIRKIVEKQQQMKETAGTANAAQNQRECRLVRG
jgi:hypothetical protein